MHALETTFVQKEMELLCSLLCPLYCKNKNQKKTATRSQEQRTGARKPRRGQSGLRFWSATPSYTSMSRCRRGADLAACWAHTPLSHSTPFPVPPAPPLPARSSQQLVWGEGSGSETEGWVGGGGDLINPCALAPPLVSCPLP